MIICRANSSDIANAVSQTSSINDWELALVSALNSNKLTVATNNLVSLRTLLISCSLLHHVTYFGGYVLLQPVALDKLTLDSAIAQETPYISNLTVPFD